MATTIEKHLQRLDAQREAYFRDIEGCPEDALYRRPRTNKWSAGEHLDHTRVFNRFFRRALALSWPVLLPFAHLRQTRPYPTEIDNVYERPNMPSKVGVLWSPRVGPNQPASLAKLRDGLMLEHSRVAAFYRGKSERLLGNAYLWDPAIGWLNLIQALHVGVHHDLHHYNTARRLLQG